MEAIVFAGAGTSGSNSPSTTRIETVCSQIKNLIPEDLVNFNEKIFDKLFKLMIESKNSLD